MEKELKDLTAQLAEQMKSFKATTDELHVAVESKADGNKIADIEKRVKDTAESVIKLNDEFEKAQMNRSAGYVNGFTAELKKAFPNDSLKSIKKRGMLTGKIDVDPLFLMKELVSPYDTYADPGLNYGTFASSVPVPVRLPGVDKTPDRATTLLDLFPSANLAANQPRLTWVERQDRFEGADTRSEGGTMAQSDYQYIQRSTDVQNISTYVKVTNEALEYWDQLLAQLRMELVPQLQRALEYQLASGTGSAPDLQGILSLVDAYTYDGLDDTVVTPSVADAVYAALTQLYVSNYSPNAVVMHPTDIAKMNLIKDKNEQYVLPPFMGSNGVSIAGIRIVPSTLITTGHLFAGDFTKTSVWFRKGIDVRVWDQNEDDVIKGFKTITADMSVAFKVPQTAYSAFVYDAIATIQGVIEDEA